MSYLVYLMYLCTWYIRQPQYVWFTCGMFGTVEYLDVVRNIYTIKGLQTGATNTSVLTYDNVEPRFTLALLVYHQAKAKRVVSWWYMIYRTSLWGL